MNPKQRMFWHKHLHLWHWVSAAVCLSGILLFSVTGITLNHAGAIEAHPRVVSREARLPAPFLESLQRRTALTPAPLPQDVDRWIDDSIGVRTRGAAGEWSQEEVYVSLPEPGADAWLTIDRETGTVEYERTDRGTISFLNDLHKGRHAGPVWSGFIDALGAACLIFSITGLFLLVLGAKRRPSTWPLVGAGAALMLVITIVFVH